MGVAIVHKEMYIESKNVAYRLSFDMDSAEIRLTFQNDVCNELLDTIGEQLGADVTAVMTENMMYMPYSKKAQKVVCDVIAVYSIGKTAILQCNKDTRETRLYLNCAIDRTTAKDIQRFGYTGGADCVFVKPYTENDMTLVLLHKVLFYDGVFVYTEFKSANEGYHLIGGRPADLSVDVTDGIVVGLNERE